MYGIKNKILFLTLSPLIIVLLIISLLTVYNKSSTEKQLLINGINSYRGLLESGNLSFDSLQDKTKLESLLNEKVEFAEILRDNYSIIYTSENSTIPLITDQEKNIASDAFKGIETTKNIKRNNHLILETITPLIVDNRVIAILHLGVSYEKSNARIIQYAIYFLSLAIIAIVFCYLFVSILLKNIILKNIYSLKNVVLEMQQNNFDIPITVKTEDEIGDFAKAFETMRFEVNKNRQKLEETNKELENSRKQLEENNKELENQVRQRTLELQTKLEEMEKMNSFMVNRELAMVKLKEENAKLKEQLKI